MMHILVDENIHVDIARGLRQTNFEVLSVSDVGLADQKDQEILQYSEEHDLILVTGDKDFGGLIEFGRLWGRGKVLLLRYHLINITRIVGDIVEAIRREAKILSAEEPVVIVLSESGYRVHKPGN